MLRLLQVQKEARLVQAPPSADERIDRLSRTIDLLVDNKRRISEAIHSDFGNRSSHTSLLADIAGSVVALKHARANLRHWMKPERRATTPRFFGWLGARAEVTYHPKGVVGIISPWNFPINLTFAPLAGVFAAGCTAILKPSERTPRTAELVADLVRNSFPESELSVVTGGEEIAASFARMEFDHILFTGSAATGRKVALAAAGNLVPTTLELGGKSPVIIGSSVKMVDAVRRIMAGKLVNAGQMCLAPDYLVVPRERRTEFVACAKSVVAQMYPSIKKNPDYTNLIDERHHSRLRSLLEDAASKGAEVMEINPANEDFSDPGCRKIPPTLVLDPSAAMSVMNEEIFGPILPVVAYSSVSEAIEILRRLPRPLGLYYFGKLSFEERMFLTNLSGGVTINDVSQHVAMEDLPFGGIGASGMGNYHGVDGFRTFSHARAVYRQTSLDVGASLRPPYGPGFGKLLDRLLAK
ncbi:MAG: coniferyl aldehyde dehydrogenase [Fibrobacteria bacterium]|nr:coniferyl aldehyde dehydrogenase [Fibrobacteria bacterium]